MIVTFVSKQSCDLLHGKDDIDTTNTTRNISANTDVDAQILNMNETTNTTDDVEAVTQTVAESDNERVNIILYVFNLHILNTDVFYRN